jgi:uncharacterized OsmC-like protein
MPATLLLAAAIVLPAVARADDAAPSRMSEVKTQANKGAHTMFSASIENRGDARHYASTKDGTFVIDTSGSGLNPIDTLLAGFAGCLGNQLRDFFRDQHIVSNGFAVKTETQLTEDGSRVSDIAVLIDLKDTSVGREKEAALMSYVEACKIYRTLSANSKISVALKRP